MSQAIIPTTSNVITIVQQMRDYAANATSERTRQIYQGVLVDFVKFCTDHHLTSLSATPETVAAYITTPAQNGMKVGTIHVRVAAISKAHRLTQHPDPTDDKYGASINSFINVPDPRIAQYIQDNLTAGQLWPEPLIQFTTGICRECGQEYYSVRLAEDQSSGAQQFIARDLTDQAPSDDGEPGFLYFNTADPWSTDPEEVVQRVPDDWLEDHKGGQRVRSDRKKHLPQPVQIGPDGYDAPIGLAGHYVGTPFRFCLHCGVTYGGRQANDFAKLSSLASEGCSTVTTILSLSAIRGLQRDQTLKPEARKMLSFTDNRQDASLQAGHFNRRFLK